MSGVLDVAALAALPERRALFHRVFAGPPAGRDDLFSLLRESDVEALPPMHISCGTEDHLFDGNEAFVRAARRAGLAPTVNFRPGEHDGAFWDAEIHTVLEWLPGLPR
jgi:putative tributyrin esterase